MEYKSSPYRWLVLLSVVPILAITQMFWLTFSAISPEAEAYYHVSALSIAVLSMSYMLVYIVMMIPASLLADKKGLRASFLLGAIVTAVFGLMRAYCGSSFIWVVVAQVGLAVAQPFLMNPITKLAAVWFPVNERATVSGVGSIAGYLGIIVAMLVTPALYQSYSMTGMLKIYGFAALAAALLTIALLREKPKVPAGPRGNVDEDFSLRKVPELRKNRNYVILLLVVFIALGVFNALLTVVSDMLNPRGFSVDEAGYVGGAVIIAGLVGGVVIPLLSDKLKKRRVFLNVALVLGLIGIAGMTFVNNIVALFIFAGISGFAIMGTGPVIFQYGTELAYPVPEGTAYGLLMGSGQISGILFILMLYLLRSPAGLMTLPLTILIALLAVGFVVSLRVKESTMIQ